MEIERKFTVKQLPAKLENYPCRFIEQGYLSTDPVVRVRREDDHYYMTYKGSGMLAREEYNLPLTESSYQHLVSKADGNIITKRRYLIPATDGLTVELDIFEGRFEGLVIAEVEFPTKEAADAFKPLPWFAEDVTFDRRYHNSYLSGIN